MYAYKTSGTCSSEIHFDLIDGKISSVSFVGGCNGNLQGIGRLVEGKSAEEVIELLSGIKCGWKSTSCPDQLAIALSLALAQQKGEN